MAQTPQSVRSTISSDDSYTDWLDLNINTLNKFMVIVEMSVGAVAQPVIQYRRKDTSPAVDLKPSLDPDLSQLVFGEIIGTGQVRAGFKPAGLSSGQATIEIRR